MLWSSTFVCAVGAYSVAMMAIFYYIIDVRGWQKWTLIFRVVGMNSITIYLAQRFINFSGISNFFIGGFAGLLPEQWASVVTQAGFVTACWLFLYFLYRKQTFLKV
jgi:predicted acyltransferase